MPLYTVLLQVGMLDGPAKAKLAAEITDLHVELAGVPKEWVRLVFQDYAAGDGFVAGMAGPMIGVTATIRSGRGAEYKRRLLTGLWDLIQRATGETDDRIAIGLQEVPPENAMEMGRNMPEVA